MTATLERAGASAGPSNSPRTNLHGRILVVEDAHCIQLIVCAILHQMKLDVDTANNGQEACDMAMASLAEGKPYDVILMDMQMPKMNGCLATKWLRDHDWKGPIIAVSIHATARDHEEFLRAGYNGFVSKPVDPAVLMTTLTSYLQEA